MRPVVRSILVPENRASISQKVSQFKIDKSGSLYYYLQSQSRTIPVVPV